MGSSCQSLMSSEELSDPCIQEVEDSSSERSAENNLEAGSTDQDFCSAAAKVTSSASQGISTASSPSEKGIATNSKDCTETLRNDEFAE